MHDKPISNGGIEDAVKTMDLVQRIYRDDESNMKAVHKERVGV
jgi:hypothetical protein